MGTGFDALTPLSHHGRTDVPLEAQRNRLLLLGLMTAAGFEFYTNEWWHYQLFNARDYPVVDAERSAASGDGLDERDLLGLGARLRGGQFRHRLRSGDGTLVDGQASP